jgi:hypothetical protein
MAGIPDFKTSIPDVNFLVNYSGITVVSARLNTPRFVPFDRVKGRCDECKSNLLDIDYAVQNEGVTIICSRMKQPKFVQFDIIEPMGGSKCFFRVKFQGKTLNVPFSVSVPSPSEPPTRPAEDEEDEVMEEKPAV